MSSFISSTFGPLSSWEVTITSNAPLLFLFLLRLNRLFVPLLQRFFRSRQRAYISRVPMDVAKELRDHPHRRVICTGTCCVDTVYSTFDLPADCSSSSWLSMINKQHDNMIEEECYFQLRVTQEERHRMNRKARLLFPDSLARYFTLVSLVVYWIFICTIVFSYMRWTVQLGQRNQVTIKEYLTFAIGLLITGVTAEWDTLMPEGDINHLPGWMKKITQKFNLDPQLTHEQQHYHDTHDEHEELPLVNDDEHIEQPA